MKSTTIEYLREYSHAQTGLTAAVIRVHAGYSVALRDDDRGDHPPTGLIFETHVEADTWAREIIRRPLTT